MYKIYIKKGELRDATDFYMKIIMKSIEKSGSSYKIVYKLRDINFDDIVVTMTAYAWLKVKLFCHNKITINWYQGIPPEEMNFLVQNRYKRIILQILLNISERIALKYCSLNIFVSNAMKQHFKEKYGYIKTNNYIMPCMNQDIHKENFDDTHYCKPTFVYSGGMQKWQCFEKTVDYFLEIKKYIPNAEFTVLTAQMDIARNVLSKKGVEGIVKYVKYDKMNSELSKYKYGFLIREDNIVNNVATPTKMSSYLACGVIPICSDVIKDFNKVFCKSQYVILVKDICDCKDQIVRKEHNTCCGNLVYKDFSYFFSSYYSRIKYINGLTNLFQRFV